jgi:hypothetical protein
MYSDYPFGIFKLFLQLNVVALCAQTLNIKKEQNKIQIKGQNLVHCLIFERFSSAIDVL